MLTEENATLTSAADFITALPADRRWRRIALVASGLPDEGALAGACRIARRDGGQILLYDVAASSGITSPYPPGTDNWLPELLDEAAMRRVGRHDLAELAQDLAGEGLLAGIYLAPKTDAADLATLVAREGVDLVISLLPPNDRRLRRVHDARRHAHVLLAPPGRRATLHPPLQAGEQLSAPERVRWPYLLIVLGTFVLARGRNRA
jgi:hypothetical protein